ncbi:solute carrier organic anion transporter family member 4A1-like [Haemaphysalis longicornis]
MNASAEPAPSVGITPVVAKPDSPEETKCGWCGFYPAQLQQFASPKWVLLCFSSAAFMQGVVINGLINVSLPTLERRFHLRSFETGMIVSSYHIGSLVLAAPVTFFGGEMRKPRLMGIGVACMGISSFVFTLPHFIAPQYRYSMEEKDLCPHLAADVSTVHPQPTQALRRYRFIFMLANMMHGCSTVPFYTLSVAYLDDNLSAQMSPRYIGTKSAKSNMRRRSMPELRRPDDSRQ